jgi:hypothetical protein
MWNVKCFVSPISIEAIRIVTKKAKIVFGNTLNTRKALSRLFALKNTAVLETLHRIRNMLQSGN